MEALGPDDKASAAGSDEGTAPRFDSHAAEDGISRAVFSVDPGRVESCRPRRPARPAFTRARDHRSGGDRKSTRLNSSHLVISYAVFCLKKKNYTSMSPSVAGS